MKAVVLAGGEGTRLRPLTYTTPKPLLPVAGVPMIQLVLARLRDHGVDEAVLSLGYRPDGFVQAYPDGRCAGVTVTYAVEPEPLDTAGGVAFAARHAGLRETFLVVNVDVLTEFDIGALVDLHRARRAFATIALTPVDDPSRFGVVATESDGLVIAFIEKPSPGTAPTNLINAGIYVLEPEVIDLIPPGRRVSIERETFPTLVARGALYALASDAYWIDTGNPACYLQANLDAAGRDSGRSTIGNDVRIDPTASVVDSVVLDGALIADGAKVRRSIVGRRAVIGAHAVVDELTVVGDGAVVAPGSAFAGARVPEALP